MLFRTALKVGLALVLCSGVLGCGGSGGLRLETWGESFIDAGIPSDEFSDGWSIEFSRFLVALGSIRVADRLGDVALSLPSVRVFDLSRPGPHLIEFADEVPAQRWDAVEVDLALATDAVSGHDRLEAEDLLAMKAGGLSAWVTGEARTGTVSFSFDWPFKETVSLGNCQTESDGLGLVVPSGEITTLQFTVHGDHLFYDSLEGDAALRFLAMADADANRDGQVTLAELAEVDLTTLPADQYATGGAGSITSLRDFVEAQIRTLVHFQGEGHCGLRLSSSADE